LRTVKDCSLGMLFMEALSVYKKNYRVELSDIDFTKKLKLSALFEYFQDIASQHADNIGYGFDALMEKYGASWMLVRIRVDVIRNPEWNEEIFIETWPLEPGRVEFERDFIVRDSLGNVIIRAVSSWVVVDMKTREIKRSSLIDIERPPVKEERAIDCKLGRLKSSGKLEVAYKKTVGYSDVDLNEHLNNSKYVDFIMDCFSLEDHKQHSVKTVEISYVNEILPGETLILYKDVSSLDSNSIYIEGVKETDGKPVFKSKVEITDH
jgi:medium-chain acyl-[acyl-carrier-protein] hydrolase